MSGEVWLAQALALFFALAALAASLLALGVRSLFAMCMGLAAVAACAAAALLAMGVGEAGVALALFGAGLAPVLILAGVLLSVRAAKAVKQGPVWFAAVGAVLICVMVVFGGAEFTRVAPAPALHGAMGLWLAALAFVAALGVVGLLGFGERGAFGGPKP